MSPSLFESFWPRPHLRPTRPVSAITATMGIPQRRGPPWCVDLAKTTVPRSRLPAPTPTWTCECRSSNTGTVTSAMHNSISEGPLASTRPYTACSGEMPLTSEQVLVANARVNFWGQGWSIICFVSFLATYFFSFASLSMQLCAPWRGRFRLISIDRKGIRVEARECHGT